MSDSKRKRGDQPDTRPQPPRLPPEMADDEATRFQSPESDTQALPPMKLPEERPQPPRRPPPPPPVALERRPTPTVAQVMEKPKRSGTTPLPPQQPPPPLLQPTRARGSSLSLPIWSVADLVGGTDAVHGVRRSFVYCAGGGQPGWAGGSG